MKNAWIDLHSGRYAITFPPINGNITTQSVASPRTPYLSMISIVSLTFELWPPKSIGFTMVNMTAMSVWSRSTQRFSLFLAHILFPYVSTATFTFDLWSQEQDKSYDIEQQPPFGDRKISNIQPKNRGGGVQNQQEHHIILTKYEAVHPTVVSENNSSSGMLII